MDINIIEQEIVKLENSIELTLEDLQELANLYTIRNNFLSVSSSVGIYEFPYYHSYVNSKRDYQLNKTTEGCVIGNMKNLCGEISQFFDNLYSNTDMGKERRCIVELIEKLHSKYHK